MGLFKPASAKWGQPRTLVAAAARLRLNDRATLEGLQARRNSSLWQDEAWEYFDAIGEVKYAFGLVAAIVSRVRLFPAVVVDQDSAPVSVTDAIAIERPRGEGEAEGDESRLTPERGIDPRLAQDATEIMETFARTTSIPMLLSAAALNLQVAGECYLAAIGNGGWKIYSTSELVVTTDGSVSIRTSAGSASASMAGRTGIPVDPGSPVGRIWRPHPRFSGDADSSMKALRADCEELLLLDRMIRTTVRSRMNAGILFVPDALSVAARTPPADDPDLTEPEDTFESELMAAMTRPIADEQDASAVIPLLVRGPADLGKTISHLTMGRDVSTQLMDRAQKVLERILQGLDVPKEIVQGLQDVKYANALVINEGMYKATIEPMALLLSDSIADIMLRPMLKARGWGDEADRITVWYDPTEVVSKPDPAEAASQGFDRFLLSGDTWRQAHGFSDADAPDPEETARRLALEKSGIAPEVAQVLLEALLPELLGKAREENIAEGGGFPEELTQALGGPPGQPPAGTGPPTAEEAPAGALPPAAGPPGTGSNGAAPAPPPVPAGAV
jgi:hypothetical protein